MADPASSPKKELPKTGPEAVPKQDFTQKAATAPEQGVTSSSGANPAKSDTAPTSESANFANTRQHVADRQNPDQKIERFANTKLNIALINDPKNGPRFTLTKRESGLVEGERETTTADVAKQDPVVVSEATINEPASDSAPAQSHDQAESAAASEPMPKASEAAKPEAVPNAATMPPAGQNGRREAFAPNPAPMGVPPAAEPPSKVPVDSSKTFVGPNGTYYDESWRWMDWRGTRQSWNWPAALSFGHWFAYRRLYWLAGIYLVWLSGLAAAVVNNVPIILVTATTILVAVLTGLYANILYFHSFRRAVSHVTEKGQGSYVELRSQLAAAGGISMIAPWIMGALATLIIAAALGATFYGRGAFSINLWPL